MNTYKLMTDEEHQLLANLWDRQKNAVLTDQEQALLDQLRAKERSQFPLEQIKPMLEAARLAPNIEPGSPLHAMVRGCGLPEVLLDFYRTMRARLNANDASITSEEKHKFEDVLRRINRCLRGGGDPPDVDSGPDFDRSVGDLSAAARTEDDAKAKPAPIVPQPTPGTASPDLPPKAEQKRKPKPKPKPRTPVRDGGRGRG